MWLVSVPGFKLTQYIPSVISWEWIIVCFKLMPSNAHMYWEVTSVNLDACSANPFLWTNAVLLSIKSIGTPFSEIWIKPHQFSFKKMNLKISPAKWRSSYSILNLFVVIVIVMMTSSNGNIFRVNGPLCGEFTGHRWIPHTKASDAELWCFLWSAPE